jgi:hypothetical protein
VKPAHVRQALFWVFILVAGFCEASFAYNGFTGGLMRWLLIGLTVLNLCLFAFLDRTPPLRKAAVYIAAAVVWGGIRYGYRWVHGGLGDRDVMLASTLLWADLVLNFVIGFILLGIVRREPNPPANR